MNEARVDGMKVAWSSDAGWKGQSLQLANGSWKIHRLGPSCYYTHEVAAQASDLEIVTALKKQYNISSSVCCQSWVGEVGMTAIKFRHTRNDGIGDKEYVLRKAAG